MSNVVHCRNDLQLAGIGVGSLYTSLYLSETDIMSNYASLINLVQSIAVRKDSVCLSALGCLVIASSMAGGQTFVDAHRSLSTFIQSVNAPDGMMIEVDGLGVFDHSLDQEFIDDLSADFGNAQISQFSNVQAQEWNANGTFFSFASTDALADGRSEIETTFVASDGFEIFGTILLNGLELGEPGGFSIVMEVVGESSGSVFRATRFDLEQVGQSLRLNWSVDLEPDTYTTSFTLRNSSFKDTFNQGSYSVGVFLPTSSTVGIFACGGLVASRRRRAQG